MSLSFADLVRSPDHFLHGFDGADALFVPMDELAYRRSIFLDNRIQPASEQAMRVPWRVLEESMSGEPMTSAGWIFHVAHCGSTLLARALAELSDGLVLREPLALRQAAVARDPAQLRLAARMSVRRYAGAPMSIVKANVPVNTVLPDVAAASPRSLAIFLSYDLSDYLVAVLRSEGHRNWLRNVTAELSEPLGNLRDADDGERAAALWTMQMRAFLDSAKHFDQSGSIDAETFFAKPEATLAGAAKLFGLDASDELVAKVASGPVFSSYAKNPDLPFDNAARLARLDGQKAKLSADIDSAFDWLARSGYDPVALRSQLAEIALN